MDCKLFRSEIEDADIDAGVSDAARAHLSRGCDACGEFYRERRSLRDLLGGLERVSAPADFEFRLRARLAGGAGGSREGFPRLRFVPRFAPVAAAVCLLVAAAFTIRLQFASPQTDGGERATVGVATPLESERNEPVTIQTGTASTGDALERGLKSNEASGRNLQIADEVQISPPAPGRGVEVVRHNFAPSNALARRSNSPAARENASRVGTTAKIASTAPDEVATAAQTVAVRVGASARPLKVVLRDERGTARVVPVQRVSFGAQDLVRHVSTNARASLAEREGVW